MMPLLLAAALAAAPLDRAHAAALNAMQTDGAGCDPAQLREAAATADITTLGRVGGSDVVLASVHQPCICGNVNCPYYVIRLDTGTPRVLYATYAYALRTIPASSLPTLVGRAHDSALISDETTAAYRNGAYAVVRSDRVRADTGARKPSAIPVRFAPGASSATLRGTASAGWYDAYTFDAAAGQHVTVGDAHARGRVHLLLYGPGAASIVPVALDKPLALPKTGTYHLQVEVASDADVPYTVTLAIR